MHRLIWILTIIVCLSFKVKKDDELVSGYVLLQSGDRKEVKFILENKSLLVREKSKYDFSQYKMQRFPYYIDAKGKKQKVTSKDVKEYGFTVSGNNFIYRQIKVQLTAPVLDKTETNGFYELAVDGKCQFYYDYEQGEGPLGGPAVITDYLLVKSDGNIFKVNNAVGGRLIEKRVNGMDIEEFFSDCESLVTKLKKKEFKKDKYLEAVNYYNESCTD